jgi:hypothetical protein
MIGFEELYLICETGVNGIHAANRTMNIVTSSRMPPMVTERMAQTTPPPTTRNAPTPIRKELKEMTT